MNPELNPQNALEKSLYLDIAVQLDSGEIINVEMQNSNFSKSYYHRFTAYGCKIIVSQCHKGDPYYAEHVNPIYQIIFIDDVDEESAKMIDTYSLRNEEGKQVRNNLITQSFVQLPYINEIVKEKGIKQLTKFELILYIFKNGITDDIMEVKDEVIEIMEKKRETFNQSDYLKMAAFNSEMKTQAIKIDSREEGLIEGIEKGKVEGVRYSTIRLFESKYPEIDHEFLENLTVKKYEEIFEMLLSNKSLEEIIRYSSK